MPLLIEDELVGALVVGDKSTGEEFDSGELSFLANLGHHAAVALNHATLYNHLEKKLRDLDTLLTISQEITSTLDLDRILKTITTMASALSDLEYCAIGLTRGGQFTIDSIGGTAPSKQEQESLRRLMEFVSLAKTEISATAAELPEGDGRDLFREHFENTETGGFWGLPLKDDQGVMGTYCQLRARGTPDESEQELLRILGNQASVAIRNAELYNQVPLIGFLEPLLEKRRKLWEAGRQKWRKAAIWTVAVGALLLLVRLPYRTGGDAAVFPGQRLQLRTPVAGIVDEVTALEGEFVGPGRPAGRILSLATEMEYRDLQNELERARREEAAARARGDLYTAQLAGTDREALTAQLTLLSRELEAATIAPPFPAVILTPHVEERKGDYLASGDVFCEVGTLDSLRIEIALPEKDWHAVELGQPVKMKFYAYAERTFAGEVDILAPAALQRKDDKRVLIATVRIPAPTGVRPGMTGVGKVRLGRRSLLWFVARPFVRFVSLRLWF